MNSTALVFMLTVNVFVTAMVLFYILKGSGFSFKSKDNTGRTAK